MEYTPRYSRLAAEISCYGPQLQKRIHETQGSQMQWAIQAQDLLAQARYCLTEYKIDQGWKSLQSAKRFEIFGMDQPERLAYAKSLVVEAHKFKEWRCEAIIRLLSGDKSVVTETPDCNVLNMAARLRDEGYSNLFYINRLSRQLFRLLAGSLFVVLLSVLLYFIHLDTVYDNAFYSNLDMSHYIVGILLFGTLGAITSALLFTRSLSDSSRRKELLSSEILVISRIFIGAGFSIFIFFLLRSSIANSINLFSFNLSNPIDYFVIAFVSGFTERLAQKSINLIIGTDKIVKVEPSV